jgi:hypothetical protein
MRNWMCGRCFDPFEGILDLRAGKIERFASIARHDRIWNAEFQ